MTGTPPSRPCLVRKEARTVKERLSNWLGGGQGTCCSSLGFSLPLLPATLAERPSPPNKMAPPAWLPLPRQRRANGPGGTRRCASATAAPAAGHAGSCSAGGRGTVGAMLRGGAVVRAGRPERARARARARTRPASCAPQRVYILTLGPVTSEHWPTPSSLRWLQHSTEVS